MDECRIIVTVQQYSYNFSELGPTECSGKLYPCEVHFNKLQVFASEKERNLDSPKHRRILGTVNPLPIRSLRGLPQFVLLNFLSGLVS